MIIIIVISIMIIIATALFVSVKTLLRNYFCGNKYK